MVKSLDVWHLISIVKYGELTPSPGPGLFGIVQDPLGALGELFFGHPQEVTQYAPLP